MPPKNDITEMDRLIETLRGIVGALNSSGLGNDTSLPVAIARIETRLDQLEKTVSVLTMVAKMIFEGALLK